MRWRLTVEPDKRQTFGETIYDVAADADRRARPPSKAIGRWFPYVATLFLFIFVINLIGFIPLPLTGETWHGFPVWGIYAATSSLSVTLALALLTVRLHALRGLPLERAVRYFKSWIPDAPKALLPLIVPSRDPRPDHAPDQPQRPSLREHARGAHPDPHLHRPDLHPRRR